MGNAVEILAARPRPRLFKIRKLSSITRFDNESQKKVASLPILVLDSRSRFADLSFHSQLWVCPTCSIFEQLNQRTQFKLQPNLSSLDSNSLNFDHDNISRSKYDLEECCETPKPFFLFLIKIEKIVLKHTFTYILIQ
jgi:hypothetical protein